jgi:hypothetical protein
MCRGRVGPLVLTQSCKAVQAGPHAKEQPGWSICAALLLHATARCWDASEQTIDSVSRTQAAPVPTVLLRKP